MDRMHKIGNIIYENKKICGKRQKDCTPTTRKTEKLTNKAFNKDGIPFLVKSSKLPQITKI